MQKYSCAAGRMSFDPHSQKVSVIPQIGQIVMCHDENNEKHFQWVDPQGIVELDLYLFKDDAVFERVYVDNVFLLYFHSYEDKYFFWVEQQTDEQAMLLGINNIIGLEDLEEEVMQPAQPVQSVPSRPEVDLLSTYLKQLSGRMNNQPALNLQKIIDTSFIDQILEDDQSCSALLEYLPEGQQNKHCLRANLLSPHFQQSLQEFQEVVQSQEGQAVMYSMGLDGSQFFSSADGLRSILEALIKKHQP